MAAAMWWPQPPRPELNARPRRPRRTLRSYPAASAAGAASPASVACRVAATARVESTARPMLPPHWRSAFSSPLTSPASRGPTPEVPIAVLATMQIPTPMLVTKDGPTNAVR